MLKKIAVGSIVALIAVVAYASSASAATTTIVTPDNTEGWSTADTRPAGAVNFVEDLSSPYPNGALQLTTDVTTTSKAQYLHQATTTLASTTNLSYFTKQVAGPVHAAASYQLLVDLNGTTTGGFTTFVYEPYQQTASGTVPVALGEWQEWDVDAGQFWSSRSFTEAGCAVVAGGGGAPFYTLADLKAACPNATVVGYGVNVGSNNPGYDVYVDGLTFGDVTYDFEVELPAPTGPVTADDCKNGGWRTFSNPTFRNQGQCVSSVVSNRGGNNR